MHFDRRLIDESFSLPNVARKKKIRKMKRLSLSNGEDSDTNESLSSDEDSHGNDVITYNNWQMTNGRISKVKISSSIDAAVLKFKEYVRELKAIVIITI